MADDTAADTAANTAANTLLQEWGVDVPFMSRAKCKRFCNEPNTMGVRYLALASAALVLVFLFIDPFEPYFKPRSSTRAEVCIEGVEVEEEGFHRFATCTKLDQWKKTFVKLEVWIDDFYAAEFGFKDEVFVMNGNDKFLASVAWDDLNSENTCRVGSQIAELFGKPFGVCDDSGQFSYDSATLPAARTALLCAAVVLVISYVFSFITSLLAPWSLLQAIGGMLLTLLGAIICAVSYPLWLQAPIIKNYWNVPDILRKFNETGRNVPLPNLTIIDMGQIHPGIPVYHVTDHGSSEYIPWSVHYSDVTHKAHTLPRFIYAAFACQGVDLMLAIIYIVQVMSHWRRLKLISNLALAQTDNQVTIDNKNDPFESSNPIWSAPAALDSSSNPNF